MVPEVLFKLHRQ